VLLKDQFGAVIQKALNLARLQRIPNEEKQLVIFFYNSPTGEQNISASNLNSRRACTTSWPPLKKAATRPRRRTRFPDP
jgi:cobaltochelatase CobN